MAETAQAAAPDNNNDNHADDDVKSILATNITVYRSGLNLSRAALAERIGITEAAVGQYERGMRTPQIDIICKLANVFNVSVDVLVGHGTSDYDAVKEYRFGKAIKFIRAVGYEVFEMVDDTIKISKLTEHVFHFSKGVLEVSDSSKLEDVINFKNREGFILFCERLSERFIFATGGQPIVERVFTDLKFNHRVSLPKLIVTTR